MVNYWPQTNIGRKESNHDKNLIWIELTWIPCRALLYLYLTLGWEIALIEDVSVCGVENLKSYLTGINYRAIVSSTNTKQSKLVPSCLSWLVLVTCTAGTPRRPKFHVPSNRHFSVALRLTTLLVIGSCTVIDRSSTQRVLLNTHTRLTNTSKTVAKTRF